MEKKESGEFEKYRQEVEKEVAAVKIKIEKARKESIGIKWADYVLEKIRQEIKDSLGSDLTLKDDLIELVLPPAHVKDADLSWAIFELAKKNQENPAKLAEKIAQKLNDSEGDLIGEVQTAGAFVNLKLQVDKVYSQIILQISRLGEDYGQSDLNQGKVAVIDYSSPNIAKPIGVGHLRSTIIGQALANLYRRTGYQVVCDNHLGDWGTQFGSLIWAYQNWGDEEKIVQNPIEELKNLYVRFHGESQEKPEIKDEARELFARLENGDAKMLELWKRFRDLSLQDFGRVYEKLGVKFDLNIGESYFVDQADGLVEECLKKGLCQKAQDSDAIVVEDLDGLPSFLLRKNDGTSLYLSRDLATLIFRIQNFQPESILYVVGSEQDLNFKQFFALAKKAGYLSDGVEAKHISFGMVTVNGKKMSTRRGTLIELDKLMAESIQKSREILQTKGEETDPVELEKTAEVVGIGAIIYNDLRQSRVKNISFDWKRMLDLEGASAVYLQYSYVRIQSILRKATDGFSGDFEQKIERANFEKRCEFDLARKLMFFPEIIARAQKTDGPHHLCGYLEELAILFNSFYNEVPILKTEDEILRSSRLSLSWSVSKVLKIGLNLLSIDLPERM